MEYYTDVVSQLVLYEASFEAVVICVCIGKILISNIEQCINLENFNETEQDNNWYQKSCGTSEDKMVSGTGSAAYSMKWRRWQFEL